MFSEGNRNNSSVVIKYLSVELTNNLLVWFGSCKNICRFTGKRFIGCHKIFVGWTDKQFMWVLDCAKIFVGSLRNNLSVVIKYLSVHWQTIYRFIKYLSVHKIFVGWTDKSFAGLFWREIFVGWQTICRFILEISQQIVDWKVFVGWNLNVRFLRRRLRRLQ